MTAHSVFPVRIVSPFRETEYGGAEELGQRLIASLAEQIEGGLRPALVVAAPVGFVNVVESKERVWEACLSHEVPCIAAMGRKGGSSIAAAILNALIYSAADLLDPEKRGW